MACTASWLSGSILLTYKLIIIHQAHMHFPSQDGTKSGNKYHSQLPQYLILVGCFQCAQNGEILPFELCVAELAPDAVGAASVLPKTIAFPVLGVGLDCLDELVPAMSEPALVVVWALTQFGEGLAELCLMLGWICPWVKLFLVSVGGAVLLSGLSGPAVCLFVLFDAHREFKLIQITVKLYVQNILERLIYCPQSLKRKIISHIVVWSLLPFYDLNKLNEPDLQNNMNKLSKQGTKNTLIIFPNSAQDQPQLRREAESDFPQMSNFDGNIDSAINYYLSQISKLHADNNRLSQQLRKTLEEKKQLADLIASFQEISKDDTDDKKKRVRRCANEIERKYICQVKGCEKSYGTEGSMAQHMKLKHPEIDYVMQNSSGEHKIKKGDSEEYEEDESARN